MSDKDLIPPPFEGEKAHPLFEEWVRMETRRQFLGRGMNALGMAALSAIGGEALAESAKPKVIKIAKNGQKQHTEKKA